MPYLRPRFFRNPQMMNKRAIRRTMPSVNASLSYITGLRRRVRPVLSPNVNAVLAFAPQISPHLPTPVDLDEKSLLPLRSPRAPLLVLRFPFLSEIRPVDLATDVTRLALPVALPGLFSASCRRSTYRRYTVPHPSLAILSFSHFPHRSS